jgi:hypothetical protein
MQKPLNLEDFKEKIKEMETDKKVNLNEFTIPND